MPRSTAPPSRRQPSQPRSRELVAWIIEAGVRILREEGPDELTTTRIAEKAGVSVGSLYQYFPNKEAVLAAVYDRKTEIELEESREWIGALKEKPLDEALREIVVRMVARHRQNLKLHPDFYRRHEEFHSLSEWEMRRHGGSGDPGVAFFRGLFEANRERLATSRIEHAAFLTARGMATLFDVVMRRRPELIFDDSFVDEVVEMFRRYLLPDAAAARRAITS